MSSLDDDFDTPAAGSAPDAGFDAAWAREVLRQAIEKKELPPDTDPESLAAFLLNSWQGALVRSLAEKSDDPLKTFMHYAFDSLLRK